MTSGGKRENAGRPQVGEGGAGALALRLTPEMLQRIDAARVVGQRTRSQAVRYWLDRGLSMEEKMKSLTDLYRRVADVQGVVRFHFKPGIFSRESFPNTAPGYKDPEGGWVDAELLQFDEEGVVIKHDRTEAYIPWANIQQVTRRTM